MTTAREQRLMAMAYSFSAMKTVTVTATGRHYKLCEGKGQIH
jgi:hypothetical protein